MHTADKFDVQPYVRPPLLSAWKGIVLCLRLLLAAPADLSPCTRAVARDPAHAACRRRRASA